jgi:phosphoglucosamine mutase
MGKLFGTDGVRGVANRELTAEIALRLGRAGAYVLTNRAAHTPKILVGMDTRRSGDMLEAALTAGLCSVGATVYRTDIIPTPGIAYLIRHYGMDAGVMISASHNPMADNGIKFFDAHGYKLPDSMEDEIEDYIFNKYDTLPNPEGSDVGIVKRCHTAVPDYRDFLLKTVPDLRLVGLRVALDCANGATSHVAPVVFKELGADVYTMNHEPDGFNINDECGSTHMESLCRYVKKMRMDVGLAFDGDGDRMLCVDENGEIVEGDQIIAVCGYDLHRRGRLTGNSIVATIMSNMGLALMCREHGIQLHSTNVGDRYVLEKMVEDDYILGGERSGHIIFREYNTTGDGIVSGLQLLSVMKREHKPLSELKKIMTDLPQALINARVPNARKAELKKNARILSVISETEAKLKGEGRVLVRPSGTEPVVRVMLEGKDKSLLDEWAALIAHTIESELA